MIVKRRKRSFHGSIVQNGWATAAMEPSVTSLSPKRSLAERLKHRFMNPENKNPKAGFRQLLARPQAIRSLGAHDCFTALLVEQGGLETVFLGGFGAAASLLGLPDVGLLEMSQMADQIRRVSNRLSIPVVADADTGYGDLHNVAHTVRSFESAGAAGMLLEDQVHPKRCGHFAGKQLISRADMVMKFKAAVDARQDPDYVLIARTDARAVEGFQGAIDRMAAYLEAGADVGFIEAPQSQEELEKIPQLLAKPMLVNMLSGGLTPIFSVAQLEQWGYKIVVCPIESLMVTAHAMRGLIQALMSEGRVDQVALKAGSFGDLKTILELDRVMGLRDRLSAS